MRADGHCFLCLINGHVVADCQDADQKACVVDGCGQLHDHFLHSRKPAHAESAQTMDRSERTTDDAAQCVNTHSGIQRKNIALRIVPVTLRASNGKEVKTQPLLGDVSPVLILDRGLMLYTYIAPFT